jgi:hypothetical protein
MKSRVLGPKIATLAILAAFAGTMGSSPALAGGKHDRNAGEVRTVTVTVEGDKDRAVTALDPADFAVYKGDTRQEIVGVKGPSEAPINLAVLIQDGLDIGVGHEAKTIREFIERLPEGSKVMVGYLRGTHFQIAEDFTTDREAASKAVRAPVSTEGAFASAPFQNMIAALRRFDRVEGRNQVILVSNGLELNRGLASASPTQNLARPRSEGSLSGRSSQTRRARSARGRRPSHTVRGASTASRMRPAARPTSGGRAS